MAKLLLQVKGLPQTMKQLNNTVERVITRLGTEVRRALRAKTPVRTGTARRGWTKRTRGDEITVENRVPYVPFLEKGTSRMRAANQGRGIIGPALKQVKRTKVK